MADENIEMNNTTPAEQVLETSQAQQIPPVQQVAQSRIPQAPQAPKQKKSHKGLKITLVIILALIVVLGAVFAFFYATKKEYVQNKWAMITKSDSEYFRWVMDRQVTDFEDKLDEKRTEAANAVSPEEWNNKGSIDVTLDAELGSLFLPSDFAGFKNVGIKYDVSSDKDKNVGADIIPYYNGEDLVELTGVVNCKDKKVYAALPDYRPEAIDLTALAKMLSERSVIKY